MSKLEKAITIAATAHRHQKDKAGAPYILHPLRLMMKMKTETEQMVAVLHDVLEDTEVTADTLRKEGFSEIVVDAVVCLTRTDDAEPYDTYIARIKKVPIARKIKLTDIEDNMDITRLDELTDKAVERLKKYHRAWRSLNDMR
jgi:(p)ppGpp synthase/HD superfamily hydrolase